MHVKELKSPKSKNPLSRSFEIQISKEDMETKLAAKIKEMQPQVKLNGFRPGKVPISHIRKMFGQSIMNDVVQETVTETTQKTIEDNKLRPAGQPKIELRANGADVTNGKADLEYTLEVGTIPEFEPVDPKTLKLTRLTSELDDKDVEERLGELTIDEVTYKKKAKTAKAKKDDAVLINFVGRVDGDAFDGGAMDEHQLVLGSNSFIPGFEDQLIGAKAGDKLDVTVTFPAAYQVADLANKEAVFETEVLEVQGGKPADLDDDLAKKFGFDDLAALKKVVSEQAQSELDGQSRMKLKRAILDDLDSKHDFDLPPNMVEAEFANIWAQVEKEKEAGQLDEDDAKKSDKKLKADYMKIAERRVRLGLVLAEMGAKAKIQISNEELQQAMVAEARRYPGEEQQVLEFFQKNPDAVAQLRAPIFEEKVVDLIIETAKITDKKVKREELFEEDAFE